MCSPVERTRAENVAGLKSATEIASVITVTSELDQGIAVGTFSARQDGGLAEHQLFLSKP